MKTRLKKSKRTRSINFSFFSNHNYLLMADITSVLARYLKKNQVNLIIVVGMNDSSRELNRMNDIPSKPNRRKLTLGDFTTIIMTQISSPDKPLKAPSVKQKSAHQAK